MTSATRFDSSQTRFPLQHIRQTVLTRAGSKSQVVEHVEEETEAAVAQEMKDQPEVIDLTDSRKGGGPADEAPATLLRHHQREAFLQQQRDLITRHTLHISEGILFLLLLCQICSRGIACRFHFFHVCTVSHNRASLSSCYLNHEFRALPDLGHSRGGLKVMRSRFTDETEF